MSIIANFHKKWKLTTYDMKVANYIQKHQRELLKIKSPLTEKMVPTILIYSLLSATQDTPTLVKVLHKLQQKNFTNPERITKTSNEVQINRILKRLRFPNQKTKRFHMLGEWLQTEKGRETTKKIVEVSNQQNNEAIEIRNQLATDGPYGIAYKTASLAIQISIEKINNLNITVIDKWLLTFLKDIGYDSVIPNYRTNGGLQQKDYLKYESIIQEKSKQINVSPSELTLMLWSKYAYWEPNKLLTDF